jgi:hypothetical protein
MQGFEAFLVSWGLGIGAGSFRSSSIATAILGSMGVVGVVSFALYMVRMFAWRSQDWTDEEARIRGSVASAAAWTVLLSLAPAMIIQGSPDPGMEFAALAGISLALRRPALVQISAAVRRSRYWGDMMPVKAPEGSPAHGWRRHSR